MSISNFMSSNLISLELDDDLNKVKAIFDSKKIHHILVLDNKELVGVVTDRDLYKHLSPAIGTNKETFSDSMLLHKKVHQIMSRNLITAPADISVNKAVLLIHDNHISCLPIVDKNSHPIGIITWRDILKLLALKYRKKIEQQC
ncbi:MAG: CBS domain-containing protein [Alteromonadaceae bacterium]|nr:CBS domain-containing protein [Alteromonadaceae bacterium]